MHGRRTRSALVAGVACAALLAGTAVTANAAPAPDPGADQVISAGDVDGRSTNFNSDWKFVRGNPAGAEELGFDDDSWRTLDVPHDWMIEQDFNVTANPLAALAGHLSAGTAWYRKSFTVPEVALGQRVSLDFDGVQQIATVFINGEQVGVHHHGYTAFSYDITDYLTTDGSANEVAVKTDSLDYSTRWYAGGGIYRDVALTVTDAVHVKRDGTFITTPTLADDLASQEANLAVATEIEAPEDASSEVTLVTDVVDATGEVVATDTVSGTVTGGEHTFDQTITVADPELWSIDRPYLYDVVSRVMVEGEQVDTYTTSTGLRTIEFNSDGFALNGEYVELRGVNLHSDLGSLGMAYNESAARRQLVTLKEMGTNAIRTAHNPTARNFIELADEMGFVVVEEAFDNWETPRFLANEYTKWWATDAEMDMKAMVRRDRNSPSVIMWSIGNEITYGPTSAATADSLIEWTNEEDGSRPTTLGNNKYDENSLSILSKVDVPGANYPNPQRMDEVAALSPTGTFISSEVSFSMQSRGYYYEPNQVIKGPYGTEMQGSSYDNHVHVQSTGGGGTTTHSETIQRDRNNVHTAGSFVWTGIDHLGEPLPFINGGSGDKTEWARSTYTGLIDTAMFKKDVWYLYQSQWTDTPMVHLLPHWNWTEGETVQVWAYTNADSVKLYLNDELVGERTFEDKNSPRGEAYRETADGKLHLSWDIPFTPGTLRAEAYADGELIATDEVTTAGDSAAIELTPDATTIDGDNGDLAFITADILDAQGTFVPRATDNLTFEVTGGTLVATDNGNPISLEKFQGTNQRKAFSGKALAIVRPDGSGAPIRVTATADGLEVGSTVIRTTSPMFSDVPEGVQFYDEIQWLGRAGVSTGWVQADGTREYRPLNSIARDAMAAFLYRLAGSPEVQLPATSPFTDVKPDNQFYKEIVWLSQEGISTGWDNGDGTFSFRPLDPIARDAMAAFLYRSADSPSFEVPAISPFQDVFTSDQFYEEIAWMHATGVATGWQGNDGRDYYRSLAPVARDAMAAFLSRYHELS
ncbi:hypothetical protein C8046_12255 [Serinibacter arcticus]|uniref:SLH domain-containing protein n=1 Tax=Serinibacter arcticus TaxID=1655435 RepID=A0A2U1ZWE9_9MICO|nr:glycoside hydrolase family 2 TIM barrel-domain containing protein [Serinibacter arcticus]PWD51317.1 hypothetical protein C8046_12255 [Serinibacter arcticus]